MHHGLRPALLLPLLLAFGSMAYAADAPRTLDDFTHPVAWQAEGTDDISASLRPTDGPHGKATVPRLRLQRRFRRRHAAPHAADHLSRQLRAVVRRAWRDAAERPAAEADRRQRRQRVVVPARALPARPGLADDHCAEARDRIRLGSGEGPHAAANPHAGVHRLRRTGRPRRVVRGQPAADAVAAGAGERSGACRAHAQCIAATAGEARPARHLSARFLRRAELLDAGGRRWRCAAVGADLRRRRGGSAQGRLVDRTDAARRRPTDRLGHGADHPESAGRLPADPHGALADRHAAAGHHGVRQRHAGPLEPAPAIPPA